MKQNPWLVLLSKGKARNAAKSKRPQKRKPVNRAAKLDDTETTFLDCSDPASLMLAAIAYLAVVAYPEKSEWTRRNAFVEACKQLWVREAQKRGYEFGPVRRNRDIYESGPITHAFRRIRDTRIPSAEAATMFLLNRRGPIQLRFLGKGERRVDEAIKLFVAGLPAWKVSRFAASVEENKRVRFKYQNAYIRQWAPTLPVLHLSMALHSVLIERKCTLWVLLLEPAWVVRAMQTAEGFRAFLLASIVALPQRPVRLVTMP